MANGDSTTQVARGPQVPNILSPTSKIMLVVDELGIPVKNTDLTFISPSGAELAFTTDDNGNVKLDSLSEDDYQIKVNSVHEVAALHSSKTDSGQHFAANQGGPSDDTAQA